MKSNKTQNRKKAGHSLHRMKVTPLTAALALAFSIPAFAEPLFLVPMNNAADMSRYETNYIEFGAMYNSEDSFKRGEWTGLKEKGGYAVGNFNLFGKDAEKANYWDLWGKNLGLESRKLGGSWGKQGAYGLNFQYQGIPHNVSDSANFIHNNLGGNHLVLPDNFPGVDGQPPDNEQTINAALRPWEVKQRRDIFKANGTYYINSETQAIIDYRYDKREGSNMMGLAFGTGGNPRSTVMPYPVDDEIQQIDGKLRWSTEKAQIEAGYYYSRYDVDNDRFSWQNPYLNPNNGWAAGSGFPNGFGQTSLMPKNNYQQFRLSGGYNLPMATRIIGLVSYGMARQNAGFAPYTINTAATSAYSPLPRNSLDGKVDTTLANLSITSRPVSKLNLKARYRYYDYDNKTPRDLYQYVQADAVLQQEIPSGTPVREINSNRLRYNETLGKTENRFDFDATYSLMRGLSIRGYYNYKKTEYSPSVENPRDDTTDNIYGLEFRKTASALVTGWLKYEYAERTGATYDNTRGYLDRYTEATGQAGIYENLPLLRHFYLSDYEQNRVRAMINIMPATDITLSFTGDWNQRKYRGPDCGGSTDQVVPGVTLDNTCMGRTKSETPSFTIDGQWTPIDGLSAYAFYTWSRTEYDQLSRSTSNKTDHPADQTRNWSANMKSSDNTFGVGFRFVPEERNYDYGFQYIWDYGKSSMRAATGSSLAESVVLPDARYRWSSVQLYTSYNWNKNLKLRFSYAYDRLHAEDWAFDNATPTSSNNFIGANLNAGDYTDHIFYLTLTYLFDQ